MALTMRPILLSNDHTSSLAVVDLANALNLTCKTLRFVGHPGAIDLGKPPVSNPSTYRRIESMTRPLLKAHSSLVIATELPYDNNYFFDGSDRTTVTSFYEWDQLTNLPRINGLLGFVLSMLADNILDGAPRHNDNTGCIYDFLWDKTGIDMRLRGGAVCRDCLAGIQQHLKGSGDRKIAMFECTTSEGYADLVTLLDALSTASKRELSVLQYLERKPPADEEFDVFLCHNSEDKDSVRKLYRQLVGKGVKPWFDEEHLVPGTAWQDELQKAIPTIRTAAVIVGPNGQGPWQKMELRGFLSEFADRQCRVIPVILADAPSVPELPSFLKQFTWVDFRRNDPPPLNRLLWGITGKKPKVEPARAPKPSSRRAGNRPYSGT